MADGDNNRQTTTADSDDNLIWSEDISDEEIPRLDLTRCLRGMLECIQITHRTASLLPVDAMMDLFHVRRLEDGIEERRPEETHEELTLELSKWRSQVDRSLFDRCNVYACKRYNFYDLW